MLAIRKRLGMTLIEITFAFGILAVTVGILIEIIVAVGNGQTERWNQELAMRRARNIAVDIAHSDSWENRVDYYNTVPGVEVTEDGGGTGWVQLTVKVLIPTEDSMWGRDAIIVFGRAR